MSIPLDALAPGGDAIARLALEHVRKGSRVLVLGSGGGALTQMFASYAGEGHVVDERGADAIDTAEAFDLIVCFAPSRLGPLVRVLGDFHDALATDGRVVVSDLVWQTAPSPDLMRAFTPPPGVEKVRPIEGYEMQIDHVGFEIEERLDFGQAEWLAHLSHHPATLPQQAAIEADERGAARYSAWLLKKSA